MTQSWAGKIKSALEGLVDGSDARARLASAAALASLRREFADRRLDAELAHIDQPWRVPFTLAPIAGPLWLADAFVTLAQSFSDAESEAHPDQPELMSALTHGQILTLLEPVDTLQGDISGVLADPNRRPALPLPRMVRPFAHTNAGLTVERIPISYARGLLVGALRLAAAAQVQADDYGGLFQHASAPPWLSAGFTAVKGDLAAAQTRIDALELRAAPIVRRQQPDEAALRTLVIDLWDVTNGYLMAGQQVSVPMLLPGAKSLPGAFAPAPGNQGRATPTRTGSTIDTAPSADSRPPAAADPVHSVATPLESVPIVPMPRIGGAPWSPAPARADTSPVRMPEIGPRSPTGASHHGLPSPSTVHMPEIVAAQPGSPPTVRPRSMPAIGGVDKAKDPPAPPHTTDPEPVRTMPHIGPGSVAPPGAGSHPKRNAGAGHLPAADPASPRGREP